MACELCGCEGPPHDCYEGCGECPPCMKTAAHDAKHDARGDECGPFCDVP